MNQINLHHLDELPTGFTVEIDTDTQRHPSAVGEPLDLRTDDGLRIWTPILGPSSVLMIRTLLEEPGRRWHIADLAGQLGLAVSNAQRTVARIERFRWLAAYDHDGNTIYRVATARPVPADQIDRLHPELAARYARHSGLVGEQA
jgi:hypothetical protein